MLHQLFQTQIKEGRLINTSIRLSVQPSDREAALDRICLAVGNAKNNSLASLLIQQALFE
jgi:hypothetical protein